MIIKIYNVIFKEIMIKIRRFNHLNENIKYISMDNRIQLIKHKPDSSLLKSGLYQIRLWVQVIPQSGELRKTVVHAHQVGKGYKVSEESGQKALLSSPGTVVQQKSLQQKGMYIFQDKTKNSRVTSKDLHA